MMAGARPTLVFIPGLLCDERTWRDTQAHFAASHRCVIVDHGLADDLVDMARQALEQAGEGPLCVIGHSMGGRVAMEMLRLAPERIRRVALLDTSWHPLPEGRAGQVETRMRLDMLAKARRDGMAAMAAEWARGMVHPRWHDHTLFDEVVAMLARKTPAHYEAQIQALLHRADCSDVLRALRIPTLLLCGEQDHWTDVSRHQEMAGWVAHSALEIVPDCGHMSPMESPDAVNNALYRWLIR